MATNHCAAGIGRAGARIDPRLLDDRDGKMMEIRRQFAQITF